MPEPGSDLERYLAGDPAESQDWPVLAVLGALVLLILILA
jgi:hypothetical protein